MLKTTKYSIIVPAYNESTIIIDSLTKLVDRLKKDNILHYCEILVVVANGDNTAYLVQKYAKNISQIKLLRPGPKIGKGRDVRYGIMKSSGKYVLFTDADMATPPVHIKPAFKLLEQGADVVIGVRNLQVIHKTFKRRVRSVVSNLLIRLLVVPGISDTQCGFKGFKAPVAKHLFNDLKAQRWGFDFEILAKAHAKKLNIKTIKIDDWFDPKEDVMGLSGESDWQANITTAKELAYIFKQRILRRYK